MQVTKELIKRVASNARLNLTDAEVDKFIPEIKEILEFFSKLNELNTDNVKPSFHPIEIKNVMREDNIKASLKREEVFLNTKNKKDDYFKGPNAL